MPWMCDISTHNGINKKPRTFPSKVPNRDPPNHAFQAFQTTRGLWTTFASHAMHDCHIQMLCGAHNLANHANGCVEAPDKWEQTDGWIYNGHVGVPPTVLAVTFSNEVRLTWKLWQMKALSELLNKSRRLLLSDWTQIQHDPMKSRPPNWPIKCVFWGCTREHHVEAPCFGNMSPMLNPSKLFYLVL